MERSTAKKPSGHTFVTSLDGNMVERDTLACCHCGAHWEVIPGSGRKRGFCFRCMGVTCGKEKCDNCVPYEMQCYEPLKADRLLRP